MSLSGTYVDDAESQMKTINHLEAELVKIRVGPGPQYFLIHTYRKSIQPRKKYDTTNKAPYYELASITPQWCSNSIVYTTSTGHEGCLRAEAQKGEQNSYS